MNKQKTHPSAHLRFRVCFLVRGGNACHSAKKAAASGRPMTAPTNTKPPHPPVGRDDHIPPQKPPHRVGAGACSRRAPPKSLPLCPRGGGTARRDGGDGNITVKTSQSASQPALLSGEPRMRRAADDRPYKHKTTAPPPVGRDDHIPTNIPHPS